MGLIGDARKVFDEMTCKPNLVTYNTVVNGLFKKGLTEDGRRIIDHMIASKECFPDTVTYTTLIDGHCKNGELELAKECIDEMVTRKFESNVLTYNAIINGLCLSGNIDEAKRMMTKMRLNGFRDDVSTYTKSTQLGRAVLILNQMSEMGCSPNFLSYSIVICSLCNIRGIINQAEVLVTYMLRDGHNLDASIYSCLVKGYCEDGNDEMGMQFFLRNGG
ncbi:pentatricopeptide repeat-containing protein At1g05670, mitochondrial-like [Malania oleifera]|uniref:pentatricopeptide repeat-containing protein At1g05670, mitochondrial-like n=1 Tax=Malania oleifera TaxID=397392 RepID=UPI0025AE1492|nr:pentatricopeptide repeat-containing protein At1g05670, mitochondrial-like [Malania oleifera]